MKKKKYILVFSILSWHALRLFIFNEILIQDCRRNKNRCSVRARGHVPQKARASVTNRMQQYDYSIVKCHEPSLLPEAC